MADEIAPGIRRVATGPVNAYLVDADEAVVLVDTGLAGNAGRIRGALRASGRAPSAIGSILLTHAHLDHAGSAAALAAGSHAEVWVHDADLASARRGWSRMPEPETRLLAAIARHLPAPPFGACAEARGFRDGQILPGELTAVHTPGHTPGQTAFHLARAGGVLFTGDALTNLIGIRLGLVNDDWPEARRSVRRLADLDFETVAFGHGPVIRGREVARVRRAIDRLAR